MKPEIIVIGAGPAGLSAGEAAARHGAAVLILDRNSTCGGQLNKQTHMFFGSREQYASHRGLEIAAILEKKIGVLPNCTLALETWVLGIYEDGALLVENRGRVRALKAPKIIAATGAAENPLAFPGCDLPGIYGAGAVQTLMNIYGVRPGNRAVMVGAGNIGLIISYQLLQAGARVEAVVEASERIGGYLVHASKIRRAGVPILTSTTVKEARGEECLTGVILERLDENMRPVAGSERHVEADLLCLAVGLSPLAEILWQAGCRMTYLPQLGGHVPLRNRRMATSNPAVYVAGDVAGIGEASLAMMQGRIAGLSAAEDLGYGGRELEREREETRRAWEELLQGEVSRKLYEGVAELEKRECLQEC